MGGGGGGGGEGWLPVLLVSLIQKYQQIKFFCPSGDVAVCCCVNLSIEPLFMYRGKLQLNVPVGTDTKQLLNFSAQTHRHLID